MVDTTPFLPGLSPVSGKRVVARFNGGEMSSDGGLLLFREVEERIGLADPLAGCLIDARDPAAHRAAVAGRAMCPSAAERPSNPSAAITVRLEKSPDSGDAFACLYARWLKPPCAGGN